MEKSGKILTVFLAIVTAVFAGVGAMAIIKTDILEAFEMTVLAVGFGISTIYLMLLEIKDRTVQELSTKKS